MKSYVMNKETRFEGTQYGEYENSIYAVVLCLLGTEGKEGREGSRKIRSNVSG